MSTSAPPAPPRPARPETPLNASPKPPSSFPTLVAVGVIVIAAGMLLPRILPRMLALSPVPDADPSTAAPAVSAQKPSPAPLPPASETDEPTPLFWMAAKVIFGLAIVAGSCIALARWSNRLPPAPTPGVLNPVAKLAIDARCVVHLVNAGGRRLLLGTDAAGVKVVLELPAR